jgi:hypothetical protein
MNIQLKITVIVLLSALIFSCTFESEEESDQELEVETDNYTYEISDDIVDVDDDITVTVTASDDATEFLLAIQILDDDGISYNGEDSEENLATSNEYIGSANFTISPTEESDFILILSILEDNELMEGQSFEISAD